MVNERKRKVKPRQLPPLCEAVKQIRAAYGDTLERFSQRVGISMNSVSRFELGKAVPTDAAVLWKLWSAAKERGLEQFDELFEPSQLPLSILTREAEERRRVAARSLIEWRRLMAVTVVQESYPELLPALDSVLAPALKIVDTVLNDTNRETERIDYRDLAYRIQQLADRQSLTRIQQRKKDEA